MDGRPNRNCAHISIQEAALQPFPQITPASHFILSRRERLETIINNLEVHHKNVKSNLISQVIASSPVGDDSQSNQQDGKRDIEALLEALRSRWDPRTPKPTYRPSSKTLQTSSVTMSSEHGMLGLLSEGVTALSMYDKQSAKTLEKFYAARERMKIDSGVEPTFGAVLEEQRRPPVRTVSYDASRDPRLRR